MSKRNGRNLEADKPLGFDDMCLAACAVAGCLFGCVLVLTGFFTGTTAQRMFCGTCAAGLAAAGLYRLAEAAVARDEERRERRRRERRLADEDLRREARHGLS